jgi:Flp pilus assembly protein TadD
MKTQAPKPTHSSKPSIAAPMWLSLGLFACSAALHAADTTPPVERPVSRAPAQPLAAAQAQIKAEKWAAAISELRRADLPGNADWNNLMGYAHRKHTPPDLVAAQRYYDTALRIDPHHQGALEYAGELALMKNDLATAEKHLAVLSTLCVSPCEPLDDLKKAITRHKTGTKN